MDKFIFGSYTHFGPAETFDQAAQNRIMIDCSICDDSYWCDGDTCDCGCHNADLEDDDDFDDDLDDDDENDDIESEED